MNQDINPNDNNLQTRLREQNMTQHSILSYEDTINQMASDDISTKNKSSATPQLLKMKETDLKKRPHLDTAYVLEEELFQFNIKYHPGYKLAKSREEAKQALEKIFSKNIPEVFNTNKYYLHLDKKPKFSIRGSLTEQELDSEKIKNIYNYLTEKYITLNKKDEFIYKMDLVPEIINDLFIIPLQYHEFRFILGFLALKITDLDNKTIDKANLLTPSLWNVLRDTFEIKFE